jgi:hypothetical protein
MLKNTYLNLLFTTQISKKFVLYCLKINENQTHMKILKIYYYLIFNLLVQYY